MIRPHTRSVKSCAWEEAHAILKRAFIVQVVLPGSVRSGNERKNSPRKIPQRTLQDGRQQGSEIRYMGASRPSEYSSARSTAMLRRGDENLRRSALGKTLKSLEMQFKRGAQLWGPTRTAPRELPRPRPAAALSCSWGPPPRPTWSTGPRSPGSSSGRAPRACWRRP